MSRERIKFYLGVLAVFWVLLSGRNSAWAGNEFEDHESIMVVVKSHLAGWYQGSKYLVEIKVDKLDPRLKMPSCPDPLTVSTPQAKPKKGRIFVTVSCAGQKPWRIFVPATIISYEDVVMMVSSLSRNQAVKRTDIELRKTNLSTLPRGYFTRLQDVIGKVARRDLYANTVLGPMYLKLPYLVKRGERITIISKSKGIVIKTAGIALENAEKGAVLKVKNISSGRVVEGKVIESGVVKVSP